MEIEEGYDILDKWESMDYVLDIWVDAPDSMVQESNKEARKVVLESKVDA